MTNKNRKDAIRAYMTEHGVNYTTAKRALQHPVVVDPMTDDYRPLAEALGGEVVDMSQAEPGELDPIYLVVDPRMGLAERYAQLPGDTVDRKEANQEDPQGCQ